MCVSCTHSDSSKGRLTNQAGLSTDSFPSMGGAGSVAVDVVDVIAMSLPPKWPGAQRTRHHTWAAATPPLEWVGSSQAWRPDTRSAVCADRHNTDRALAFRARRVLLAWRNVAFLSRICLRLVDVRMIAIWRWREWTVEMRAKLWHKLYLGMAQLTTQSLCKEVRLPSFLSPPCRGLATCLVPPVAQG